MPLVDGRVRLRRKEWKPVGEFHRYRGNPDGLRHWCKDCSGKAQRASRLGKEEQINAENRARYHRDLEASRLGLRKRNQRRRALEANAEGYYTEQDIRDLYVAQEGRCAYDGADLSVGYHVDHMIPLSRPGGTNSPHNLCLTCGPCNLAKGQRTAEEFRAYLAMQPVRTPRAWTGPQPSGTRLLTPQQVREIRRSTATCNELAAHYGISRGQADKVRRRLQYAWIADEDDTPPPPRHRLSRASNNTHCARGHPWDDENTYISPAGTRQCRACQRMRQDKKKVPQPPTRREEVLALVAEHGVLPWSPSNRSPRNPTGYHGVSFRRRTQRWRALAYVQDRQILLGEYDTPEDAARTYNAFVLAVYGPGVQLNDID